MTTIGARTTNAYTTVTTAGTVAQIQAYLYDHTKVVYIASSDVAGRFTHLLLETTVKTIAAISDQEAAQAEARRLAQYQADRLASGLYGVSPVFNTRREAVEDHYGKTSVWLADEDPSIRVQNEAAARLDLAQHAASVITSGRTILAQGVYQAASGAALTTIAVLAVSTSPSDPLKPYSTHWAIYTPQRGWHASDGEYDLTWEEAAKSLAGRH